MRAGSDGPLQGRAADLLHRPRKRFAQNFLRDTRVAERIVNACGINAGDAVFEVGPGQGALTEFLLSAGADLTAVELDRDLSAGLRQRWPSLRLIESDVLKLDIAEQLAGRRWIVVGNLPYNISTPLMFHVLPAAAHVRSMVFMLQEEVVQRICAQPNNKTYGRLTVMLGHHFSAQPLFAVSPAAFQPQPQVHSRIVRLVPRDRPPPPRRFSEVVRRAFSQRRKTLRNALSGVLDDAAWRALQVDPARRPETLSIDEFVMISAFLERG